MDAGMHGGAIHATQVREDAAKAVAQAVAVAAAFAYQAVGRTVESVEVVR